MTRESRINIDYMITPFLQILQLILKKEVNNLFLGNKHTSLSDLQEKRYIFDPLPFHNLAFSIENHVGQIIRTDVNNEIKWCLLYDNEIFENFSDEEYEVLRPFLSTTMNHIEERMQFLQDCLHNEEIVKNIRPEYLKIVKEILVIHYNNHLNKTYNGSYASVLKPYQIVLKDSVLYQLPIMVQVHQDFNDKTKICVYSCSLN